MLVLNVNERANAACVYKWIGSENLETTFRAELTCCTTCTKNNSAYYVICVYKNRVKKHVWKFMRAEKEQARMCRGACTACFVVIFISIHTRTESSEVYVSHLETFWHFISLLPTGVFFIGMAFWVGGSNYRQYFILLANACNIVFRRFPMNINFCCCNLLLLIKMESSNA